MRGLDDDRLALDLLIRGFQISRVIRLVADLGIADRILPEAVSNVTELASASGVLPEQLAAGDARSRCFRNLSHR